MSASASCGEPSRGAGRRSSGFVARVVWEASVDPSDQSATGDQQWVDYLAKTVLRRWADRNSLFTQQDRAAFDEPPLPNSPISPVPIRTVHERVLAVLSNNQDRTPWMRFLNSHDLLRGDLSSPETFEKLLKDIGLKVFTEADLARAPGPAAAGPSMNASAGTPAPVRADPSSSAPPPPTEEQRNILRNLDLYATGMGWSAKEFHSKTGYHLYNLRKSPESLQKAEVLGALAKALDVPEAALRQRPPAGYSRDNVPANVERMMQTKRWSRLKLAEEARLPHSSVYNALDRRVESQPPVVKKLADALGVSAYELQKPPGAGPTAPPSSVSAAAELTGRQPPPTYRPSGSQLSSAQARSGSSSPDRSSVPASRPPSRESPGAQRSR